MIDTMSESEAIEYLNDISGYIKKNTGQISFELSVDEKFEQAKNVILNSFYVMKEANIAHQTENVDLRIELANLKAQLNQLVHYISKSEQELSWVKHEHLCNCDSCVSVRNEGRYFAYKQVLGKIADMEGILNNG